MPVRSAPVVVGDAEHMPSGAAKTHLANASTLACISSSEPLDDMCKPCAWEFVESHEKIGTSKISLGA
eukprot:5961569-Pyramimonas_sp.AAC.1